MQRRHLWIRFLRLAFHLFNNPLASTYDLVSAVVSRGHWRRWTRAAIPEIRGTRILEIPCGTGNLLLDLVNAEYRPMGVDLSPSMLRITRDKLRQTGGKAPLVRARAESLPFADRTFDSIVMTFPPGFVYDPRALDELRRVLDREARLIWVDAGRLLPLDWWSRALNRAFDIVDGEVRFVQIAGPVLKQAGFEPNFQVVRDEASEVIVTTATKGKD